MGTYGEEQERVRPVHEMAARINAGRKPKFGDAMRNLWASDGNPTRDAKFVRLVSKTGRCNPGEWYEMTDGAGKFWQSNGLAMVFIDQLEAP